MTYEEAIEAERTGTLVTYQGHSYRVKGHKKVGNGGHFVVIVQRMYWECHSNQLRLARRRWHSLLGQNKKAHHDDAQKLIMFSSAVMFSLFAIRRRLLWPLRLWHWLRQSFH